MANWFAPTHHDHLVAHYALDPATMVFVDCACGLKQRRADYMVDVTGLPMPVRRALGIQGVDYLCDGCTTRLFRERHISQEDFNRLLGAPSDNLARVRLHDQEHARGVQYRPPHAQPAHAVLDVSGLLPSQALQALGGAALQAFIPSVTGGAPLPLQRRTLSHADSAAQLMRRGVLSDPNPPLHPTLP